MKFARILGSVFFVGVALGAFTANAETLVVVEARGIGLKPGATVDSNAPLKLQQGQHITLISQSGETLTLDGPNDKPPAMESQRATLGTAMAALTTDRDVRTGEVGTTRGKAGLAPLPDPWLVDVTRPGHACLLEGQTPIFWRPDSKTPATVTVMPDDRSWRVDTLWPAGLDRIAVKTNVPMHGGATYFVAFDGNEFAISVAAVPATLSSDSMRAAWMANMGCEAQAEAMVRTSK